jgi:hypothetical protein
MKMLTRRYLDYGPPCYVVTFYGDGLQSQRQGIKVCIESGTRGRTCEPIHLERIDCTVPEIMSAVTDRLRREHPGDSPRWHNFIRIDDDGQVSGWTYPVDAMVALIRERKLNLDLAHTQLEYEPEILALCGGLDDARRVLDYCAKALV